MKYLRVNDYDMAYIEVGRGTPLVCVHGTLNDFRAWSPLLGPLSQQSQVMALSLRHFFPEHWDGVGGSFTIQQHVSDVISFIEKQGCRVDLIGHSRGGHIAFRVAQRRPDLLRKLILCEPGGELDTSQQQGEVVQARTQRVAASAKKIAAGDIDGGLQTYVDGIGGEGAWHAIPVTNKQEYRDNARTLLGQINERRRSFSRADAEAISVPTLFVCGEKTSGSSPIVLRALAGSVRGSKTTYISGAAHHMIRDDPVRTSAAVLEFSKS